MKAQPHYNYKNYTDYPNTTVIGLYCSGLHRPAMNCISAMNKKKPYNNNQLRNTTRNRKSNQKNNYTVTTKYTVLLLIAVVR